ncbi:MAG: DUF1579 domain-containing protein [Ignavibacteria bacterium]|jgi:hypothetical protein|nr:DUF1579 domain-containing protein [Ignavibacteria bacterium]MBK8383497.1 DUF1579 domain-containing protein [Ignavibacteria bacterium]MBK9403322.1 DUF1579 domain-containing protein [Ignavibacteria bacterium]MBL0107867.1 DUF1579 domain-containing protein [Ignavibacteria bacterium]
MKSLTKFLLAVFILTISSNIFAQTEAEQKAWMEYMAVSPVHEMLAKSNGEWNQEITFWMDETSPPMSMNATCTNKMILGGRYQESLTSGSMMGMPFEGISTLAYDNFKKMYYTTWIDNMGTGIMYMSGKSDASGKVINFTGTQFDPLAGKDLDARQVFTVIDDNNQKIEMFITKDGKEMKTMEIKFSRK